MDKNTDKIKELQEIRAKLDKSEQELKQIQADMVVDSNNEIYYKCMDSCYQMVSSLRQYVYYLEDGIYKDWSIHKNGHLPPIKSAEKFENALEILGIGSDFDVQKPVIYISASRQGNKEFEIDLNIKSNK